MTHGYSELLREWFHGVSLTETRGGAAIVAAARLGQDDLVAEVSRARGAWVLKGKERVRRRITDYMAIRGLQTEDVATLAGVSVDTVKALANRGISPTGNLDANRVVRALGIDAVQVNAVSESAA